MIPFTCHQLLKEESQVVQGESYEEKPDVFFIALYHIYKENSLHWASAKTLSLHHQLEETDRQSQDRYKIYPKDNSLILFPGFFSTSVSRFVL